MNIRSQHGITLIVIIFIGITILLYTASMATNLHGLRKGTDTIGETVGNTIDNITAEETAMTWWVNNQRNLVPNKHAVESHGADSWVTVDCYNRNGTFHVMSKKNGEFHLLCRDNDGKIRDMILQRRSSTSGEFDLVNAFTPKDGTFKNVIDWIVRNGGSKGTMPDNAVIYIDGIAP